MTSVLIGVCEHMIAEVHAGTMQSTFQRVHRDPETRGGFGRAELLDVTKEHDLAVAGLEGSERGHKQLGTAMGNENVARIGQISGYFVFRTPERDRVFAVAIYQRKHSRRIMVNVVRVTATLRGQC